jgi:diguanylate cyclase (GGDEF)-like protein
MTAGLALLIVTDTVYSYLTTTGTYDGGLVDCGWLFAYVLWTGAMLHPSVARSAPAAAGGPPRVSRGRLALVAAGTLLVPAVLLIQGVRHDLESTWLAVAVVAVVLFGLVLTRMSGFVTQVQSQSQQLEDLAMRDELTGLANRRQLEQRIALVAGGPAQVLVLDLTGFKQVNDRFGHAAGDQLLAGVAARLTAKIRGRDLVARMGGDEFAVLVPDATTAEGDAVAERLVAVFGGGQAVLAVTALHQLGIRIALDDFGTGHSSLGLLQTVPVDILKVDKSFVDNITMAGRHAVIATALIQVADGLGLTAVAEGVETAEQAAELHRIGYRLAQGYHFGRPIAEPDFRSPQALVV